jgi:hypothetical protein
VSKDPPPPPQPPHFSHHPHHRSVPSYEAHYEPHYSQVHKPSSTSSGGLGNLGNSSGCLRSSYTSNPDYHSIADTMLLDDPDYDQVQEVTAPISPPEEFDIDPNYAELQDTAVVIGVGGASGGQGQGQAQGQPLLQQQQATTMRTTTTTTLLRSEPIYQEITEGTML